MRFNDVPPWPVYGPGVAERLSELVSSGAVFDYAGRGAVRELEEEFSRRHDGRHVVSFNSGTSALFAALCGLGVGAGDEVIVANLTFLASASPALWLGAKPVLVDSGPDDASIDPAAVDAAITDRTRVVVVTHLFGNPVDLDALAAVCARHGVALLEDCSHAHASTVDGRPVGLHGAAAIWSIGASKLVSGGHGGLLVTADATVRDIALMTGHFKPRTRTDVLTASLRPYAEFALGGNLRLSPFAAVLALDHLTRLEELSTRRRANVAVIDEQLAGLLVPLRAPSPRENRSHFDLVYLLPDELPTAARGEVLKALEAADVPASAPSTRPLNRVLRAMPPLEIALPHPLLHRLTALGAVAPDDDRLPHSTGLHDRMVSLPANRLYVADPAAAQSLGVAVASVMRPLVEGVR